MNRIADGDFESGIIGFSIDDTVHFPMFAGGWASHGERTPELTGERPFEGSVSARVASSPGDPLAMIQDIPLDTPAYGMRIAFLIESGSQTIRMIDGWNRRRPDGNQEVLAATLSASAVEVVTPTGSWTAATSIEPGRWHTLTLISDPRLGIHSVSVDGESLMAVPSAADFRPSTLILGGDGEQGAFRYDAIEVLSLVDLEMSAIRAAVGSLDAATRNGVLGRLHAAEMALTRGSEALALPELGVARNILTRTTAANDDLRRALSDLIDLIEASDGDSRERRRPARF